MKHPFPTDEDEILELAKNMIKGLTSNPNFPNPPIPIAELQRLVDEVVMARYAEAVAKEVEKQVREEAQAAREKLRSAQQSLQEHNRKYGTYINDARALASGRGGLAENVFAQLAQQSATLQFPKKERD